MVAGFVVGLLCHCTCTGTVLFIIKIRLVHIFMLGKSFFFEWIEVLFNKPFHIILYVSKSIIIVEVSLKMDAFF